MSPKPNALEKRAVQMDILSFITTLIAYTLLLPPFLKVSFALDSISQSLTLSDDGTTLVSRDGTFELGFFSPGSSHKRYLGIWFKNIPIKTVVWVANRASPINDSNGILTLTNIGNLVLTHNNTPVWDISSSVKQPAQQKNPVVAQLLDSGNLVVRGETDLNPESYLWQSFDYPTDTSLAGMKFGFDRRTGLNRKFTAWKSPDDPSPGDYSWSVVMHEYPDTYMEKGTQVLARLGPWNGLSFSGTPQLRTNPIFNYEFVFNKDEAYYSWTLKNSSVMSITVLNQSTYTRYRYVWSWTDKNWKVFGKLPLDRCDTFGLCGANGYCAIGESPMCQCLKGFKAKSPQRWDAMDWTQGCVRNTPLNCKDQYSDRFVKLVGLKVPDTTHTWVDETMSLDECREKCLSNCSCLAFTNSDIRGAGNGCVMWFDDLIDIQQFAGDGGQNLYVRMEASEIEREDAAHGRKKKLAVIVATIVTAILGMLLLGFYRIYTIRRNMIEKHQINNNNEESDDDVDLPLLDLSMVAIATDNFSEKNKIGEGGFGPVYKGRLGDGQEIAVKKLSRSSGQGIIEFKNEVKLIAKLQHRNLVKLLGCCIQGQEKILVYEYMPNNSLDTFIFGMNIILSYFDFSDNNKQLIKPESLMLKISIYIIDLILDVTDSTKGILLDWLKRFHIICGIARGLIYLHQDSRLRIIHRDLKASNVLLDEKLNPKISDFGLAKTCRGDQIEGNTNRVVGTYGYMAPEYAIDGQFSVKSDVFSFGILLLEIISGKRNRGFHCADYKVNLIGHAWTLWNEGKAIELIDPSIKDSCIVSEALHCIHVSLLCVQQYPEDRPSMPSVVLMLGSEIELPIPKEPGFFLGKMSAETSSSSNQGEGGSINEITITSLAGR